MWIKVSKVNPISVGTAEVLAINSTTAKALWLSETPNGFALELETPIAPDKQISRHLALLGVFDTSEQAKQKVDEFLAEAAKREGLFEM